MNKAYIAGANALAPSAPMLLLETSKMDIAPLALLSHWLSKFPDVQNESIHMQHAELV